MRSFKRTRNVKGDRAVIAAAFPATAFALSFLGSRAFYSTQTFRRFGKGEGGG
jgi:hypothetical protein